MTDDRFWALIDEARAGFRNSALPNQLRKVLEQLSNEEILEFGHKFYENLCVLNHWNLWAAGYVVTGGMGDDSFHYFRSWIIGKGKIAFDLSFGDAAAQGGALALILGLQEYLDLGVEGGKGGKDLARAVAGTVIDADEFEGIVTSDNRYYVQLDGVGRPKLVITPCLSASVVGLALEGVRFS